MKLSDGTDYRLDPADKAEWVADLRSGKYKQGFNELCTWDNKAYCCLGVYQIRTNCETRGSLSLDPSVIPNEIQTSLTVLNDGDEQNGVPSKSFNYIASYIERYL